MITYGLIFGLDFSSLSDDFSLSSVSDLDSSVAAAVAAAAGVNFTLPLVVGDVTLISPFVFSCCFSGSFSSLAVAGLSVLSVSFGFSVDFSSAMAFSIS